MNAKQNPLGSEDIGKLIRQFSVPSIIGMLVTSIYNMVDQLFIGKAVGALGNAATNIAFPLVLVALSMSLLLGIGGAANFNLNMGAGKKDKAPFFIGNAFTALVISGIVLLLVTRLNLQSLLVAFGSPDDVLPYAMSYVGITSLGFPFMILFVGGGHLIRADGSPRTAMFVNLSGAVINVFLDYLFTMVWKWGIEGAAYATVIGQVFSGILTIIYITRYKTVKLTLKHFIIRLSILGHTAALGVSSFTNQIAIMIVQIATNNLLKFYGAQSIYGAAIPIACVGIVMKINQIVFGIVIGTAQGTQPIYSFNYGAKQYDRVRLALRKALTIGITVSVIALVIFQLFPRQIFGMFANGAEPETYYAYGEQYLKTFFMFVALACLQPIANTFFSAIGKPGKGMVIALVKQIGVLLPAMFILTPIVGVDGVRLACPAADLITGILVVTLLFFELKGMRKLELKEKGQTQQAV